MPSPNYDRVVFGGGIFGMYSAIHLAKQGFRTLIIEKEESMMRRASFVNQARLHTGLHYPRSLMTAKDSLGYFERFKEEFGSSIKNFDQIYAISSRNSKTNSQDFRKFIDFLGVSPTEVDPNKWFHPGTVDAAFQVEEPTFDSKILKQILERSLERAKVDVWLGAPELTSTREIGRQSIELMFDDGSRIETDKVVLATYASTNSIRRKFDLPSLPLFFELAEVVIGTAGKKIEKLGFTVMDGPFWSLMPFGGSGKMSLTSVGLTPLLKSENLPKFDCQKLHGECTTENLFDCNTCFFKPPSMVRHQVQQMKKYLIDYDAFTPEKSLYTIKTILKTTSVDDARPTYIGHDLDEKVTTVFSGKISTIFDLERALL